jgi:thiamine-monophosphate kinase
MKEFSLIEKIFKPLTNGCKAAQNLADDVAKISLKKDEELIISKDVFVEDVHFLLADGGFKIASKLLRTNLSDLAASGAKPVYYMLGFSKNKKISEKFLSDFGKGLKSVQDEFGLDLIGGDTASSKKLFFSVTIFGIAKKAENLSRQNAKAGDLIFVSGTIGDASLGLALRQKKIKADKKTAEFLLDRHFFPSPRIKLGRALTQYKLAKCAIDISDGFLADLRQICKSSALDAEVFLEKFSFSKSAKKLETAAINLLAGGDDYELIFCAPKKNLQKILALKKSLQLEISCVGELKKMSKKSPQIILRDANSKKIPIKKFGYEH